RHVHDLGLFAGWAVSPCRGPRGGRRRRGLRLGQGREPHGFASDGCGLPRARGRCS
ncbi:unnamed protein product, partial [Symbiodinium sp. CCMP2456]